MSAGDFDHDAQSSHLHNTTDRWNGQDSLAQLRREIDELTDGPSEEAPKTEAVAPTVPDSPETEAQAGEGKGTKGPSQGTIMSRLAQELFDLGCTPGGLSFATRKDRGPVAIALRGGKKSLRAELAKLYAQRYGTVPGSSGVSDAMLQLEGMAQSTTPVELGVRVARHPSGGIVVDLGRDDGRSILVTGSGWEVTDSPGVIWRRTALTGEMPMPVRGGSIKELWALTNVAAEDRPLVVAWLMAALIPDIPHPILTLTGVQGTAKSTTARLLVSLIDPSTAPLRAVPKDVRDWSVAVGGAWLAAIDNVSTIPSWWADALCRASTGDGLVTRKMYSDDGLLVLAFRRLVILTSIDAGAMRGDLADRLITIELERIDPSSRREDSEVSAAIDANRPRLFGALLDLLAQVLARMPEVHLDELPRMADFGRVLATVDAIAGTKGMARYLGQADALFADVVEGDEVARAIRDFVRSQVDGKWEGTASELLNQVRPEHASKWWPDNGRALSGRLRNATVALASAGVEVVTYRSHGVRLIRLSVADTLTGVEPSGIADEPRTRKALSIVGDSLLAA